VLAGSPTFETLMRARLLACACGVMVVARVGEMRPPDPRRTDDACTLAGVTPQVIAVEEAESSEWHGRFDLADNPRLWEPAARDEALARFRTAVRDRLGAPPDARALIARQRAIFAAAPPEWRGEATNSTLLLEGKVASIAPISCLEAMLWKWQAARYPMLEHPTEFGAFVLRAPGRVRVYLSSADLVGQKIRPIVTKRIEADRSTGFRLFTHVHNHPFLFDRKVGDRMWTLEATKGDVAGALAPSMTDVRFFRNLRESQGLEEAWVTNGLESARFRAREFEALIDR
jgi:hypothetical protein